jgi:hypothetical protein
LVEQGGISPAHRRSVPLAGDSESYNPAQRQRRLGSSSSRSSVASQAQKPQKASDLAELDFDVDCTRTPRQLTPLHNSSSLRARINSFDHSTISSQKRTGSTSTRFVGSQSNSSLRDGTVATISSKPTSILSLDEQRTRSSAGQRRKPQGAKKEKKSADSEVCCYIRPADKEKLASLGRSKDAASLSSQKTGHFETIEENVSRPPSRASLEAVIAGPMTLLA